MIGRAAYHQPADVLSAADQLIFGIADVTTVDQAIHAMLPYMEAHMIAGGRLHQITRHMLGLFAGRPGARAWRRMLSDDANKPGVGPELVLAALAKVKQTAQELEAAQASVN
jgi:tRNA-dihydrouridine synthase A